MQLYSYGCGMKVNVPVLDTDPILQSLSFLCHNNRGDKQMSIIDIYLNVHTLHMRQIYRHVQLEQMKQIQQTIHHNGRHHYSIINILLPESSSSLRLKQSVWISWNPFPLVVLTETKCVYFTLKYNRRSGYRSHTPDALVSCREITVVLETVCTHEGLWPSPK